MSLKYPILSKIAHPNFIHQLSNKKIIQLIGECRQRIIEVTSKSGGHLASSLGTVELTVALLKKFDLDKDFIIWDVGHQAYSYKLLTGRNKSFDTIGSKFGISKFLKRSESSFDHFGAGHASTSISAALGICVSQQYKKKKGKVIAIIGDGALTGGLAFEAMNHAGHIKKNLLVILNENDMSIDPNVGSLSKTFNFIKGSDSYNKLKKKIKKQEKNFFFSKLVPTLKRINTSFMEFLSPSLWFGKLGFEYFGPIDGHDFKELTNYLNKIENIEGPVLLHIRTVKGKGLSYAESDSLKYHGVNPFEAKTGKFLSTNKKGKAYTSLWSERFTKIFSQDKKVIAISAAMIGSTGLSGLYNKFPDRIFDVGIAEAHAVTFAAGAATQDFKPFVCIYSTFLQRALDNIIHDVALQNLPVKFVLDRAGFVGADGVSHHGIFDLSYLRMIPNMVIMTPKNGKELISMIDLLYKHNSSPIALRYPRGTTEIFYDEKETIELIKIGKGEILRKGKDICIFAIGIMVEIATVVCDKLLQEGISCSLINARFVKPLDEKLIIDSAKSSKAVVTLEENVVNGGFGSAVQELLQKEEIYKPIKILGVVDKFFYIGGSSDDQREMAGLDIKTIQKVIKKLFKRVN